MPLNQSRPSDQTLHLALQNKDKNENYKMINKVCESKSMNLIGKRNANIYLSG